MAAAEYFNPRPVNTLAGNGSVPTSHHRPMPPSSSQLTAPYQHPNISSPGQLSPYDHPPPYNSPGLRPQNMQAPVDQKPLVEPALRRGSSHPVQPRPHVSFASPGLSPSPNPYAPPQQQYFPPPPGQQYVPPQQLSGPISGSQGYSPQPQYQQPYPPQFQQHPSPYSPFPPQQQALQPYVGPHAHNGFRPEQSTASLGAEHGGYSSDPEAHRRDHHRRRHHRGSESKRDHTAPSLFGGAAGGLIGDLIFPGLGTVGGALAGFVGGREHSKHKEKKEQSRRDEQRKWDRKWSKGEYERERPRFDDKF